MQLPQKIRGSLLAVLVFMPAVVCSYELLDYALIPRYLLLCVFSCVFAGLLLSAGLSGQQAAPLRITVIRVLFMIWLVTSMLSGLMSDLVGEYLFEVHRLGLYFIFFLLLSSLLENLNGLEQLLKVSVLVVLLLSGIAGWQFVHYSASLKITGMSQVTAMMSNKNLFSEYVVLIIPFCAMAVFKLSRWWRLLGSLAILSGLVFVVMLYGRAAWLGLTLMVIYAGGLRFLSWKRGVGNPVPYRFLLLVVFVLIGIGLLFFFIDDLADGLLTKRLTLMFYGENIRVKLWYLSWEMVKDHPMLGIGLGDWKIASLESGVGTSLSKFLSKPHNDYVGLLSETGVLSGLAYIGCLAVAFVQLVRAELKHPDNRMFLTVSAALVAFAVISFFSFPLHRIEHSAIMLFGLAMADRYSGAVHVSVNKVWRNALILMLFAMTIGALAIGVGRYQGEKHMKVALEARMRGDWPAVIRSTRKVNTFLYPVEPSTTPVTWYSGIAHFQMNRQDAAMTDFEESYRVNPNHIHVLNNLATCHALNGNIPEAIELYEKAFKIYPGFSDAISNLVALYVHIGEYDKAEEVILESTLFSKDRVNGFLTDLKEYSADLNGKSEIREAKLTELIRQIKIRQR